MFPHIYTGSEYCCIYKKDNNKKMLYHEAQFKYSCKYPTFHQPNKQESG